MIANKALVVKALGGKEAKLEIQWLTVLMLCAMMVQFPKINIQGNMMKKPVLFALSGLMAFGMVAAVSTFASGSAKSKSKKTQLVVATNKGGEEVRVRPTNSAQTCARSTGQSIDLISDVAGKPSAYVVKTDGQPGANFGKVRLNCSPGKYTVRLTSTKNTTKTVRLKKGKAIKVEYRKNNSRKSTPAVEEEIIIGLR